MYSSSLAYRPSSSFGSGYSRFGSSMGYSSMGSRYSSMGSRYSSMGSRFGLSSYPSRFGSSSGSAARTRFFSGVEKKHVESGAEALRQGGEAVLVGALMGAIHCTAKGGLDVALDKNQKYLLPLDGLIGLGAMVSSVMMAGEDYSGDLANVGAACIAIFGFRKTTDWMAKSARKDGKVPGYQKGLPYLNAEGYTPKDQATRDSIVATRDAAAKAQAASYKASFGADYSHSGFGADPIMAAGRRL